MVFKLSLFLVLVISLAANIWLWGNWKLSEQDYRLSITLYIDSMALLFCFIYPVVYLVKQRTLSGLFKLWRYRISYLIVVLSTIILAIYTFWWMRVYMLPFQIAFGLFNGFLFAKKRGWVLKGNPAQDTEQPS